MYKKLLFLFLLIGFSNSDSIWAKKNIKTENQAYQSGENLKYSIKYGFIKGGYISLTVKDTFWNGKKTHELELAAKTSGVVDVLFKVRDRYASYLDPITDQPLKSVRDIREGSYTYYNEVLYNYNSLHQDSITIQSQKSGDVKVPSNIQDIVSAFYFARRYKFNDSMKRGEILELTTYFSDEIFPLKIKYMGTETIKTNFGKMECYIFHPVTEVGRMFKTEDDMTIWITRDKNRIPIKLKTNLKVGAFTCELESYEGLLTTIGTK